MTHLPPAIAEPLASLEQAVLSGDHASAAALVQTVRQRLAESAVPPKQAAALNRYLDALMAELAQPPATPRRIESHPRITGTTARLVRRCAPSSARWPPSTT